MTDSQVLAAKKQVEKIKAARKRRKSVINAKRTPAR